MQYDIGQWHWHPPPTSLPSVDAADVYLGESPPLLLVSLVFAAVVSQPSRRADFPAYQSPAMVNTYIHTVI